MTSREEAEELNRNYTLELEFERNGFLWALYTCNYCGACVVEGQTEYARKTHWNWHWNKDEA